MRALALQMGNDMTNEQLEAAMTVMDTDGNGEIELSEFMEWWRGCEADRQNAALFGDVGAVLLSPRDSGASGPSSEVSTRTRSTPQRVRSSSPSCGQSQFAPLN